MNDKVIKSNKVSRKKMGFSLPSMNINPKYWEMKKAQRERWAKEDKLK